MLIPVYIAYIVYDIGRHRQKKVPYRYNIAKLADSGLLRGSDPDPGFSLDRNYLSTDESESGFFLTAGSRSGFVLKVGPGLTPTIYLIPV